eukprot:767823-Hanusia_phi.AAC.1
MPAQAARSWTAAIPASGTECARTLYYAGAAQRCPVRSPALSLAAGRRQAPAAGRTGVTVLRLVNNLMVQNKTGQYRSQVVKLVSVFNDSEKNTRLKRKKKVTHPTPIHWELDPPLGNLPAWPRLRVRFSRTQECNVLPYRGSWH